MAVWLGFLSAGVAVVFFGSQLLPVKRFETGDGLYFQWVLCIGIWMVGLVVQLVGFSFFPFSPALLTRLVRYETHHSLSQSP